MYSFRNIDSYIPLYYEKQGMLKFKLWMENKENFKKEFNRNERGLFKPRRKEYGHSLELFCGNHYGETVGSILAEKTNMPVCKAELVRVHTEKNKYTHGVIQLKEGCISYSDLHRNETLIPGNIIIDKFRALYPDAYSVLANQKFSPETNNNNIEIILSAIEFILRREKVPENEIKQFKRQMIQMVVYDCAFGNNDRHDENWSIARDVSTNNLRLYPAYDNERVLGLYENQDLIKNSVDKNNVQDVSKSLLTSRIGIPGHPEKVTYDIMLQYLSEHYPEETLEFMTGIVQNVSEEDISSILSNLEGLPSEYIEFGTSTYSDRKKTMEKLIDKIKSKKREESISL